MMNEEIEKVLTEFPFLSYGKMDGVDYIGIVQNADNRMVSMYLLSLIPNADMRKYFLDCGEEWWWGSNREIPINIFLKNKFRVFRPCIRHFSRKDFEIIHGPLVSLQHAISKRVRRRVVTMLVPA